jgi:death on curing protein
MPTHLGRPTKFDQALEMAEMTWAPVLEILGDPVLAEMDLAPYSPERFHFNAGTRTIETERARGTDDGGRRWLTVGEVLRIHDEMIERFGGVPGTPDSSRVASMLERARDSSVYGHDPFPTILHKAAAILHDILVYHPFVDGQKRTGLSSAFIFLGLNGYTLWSRDPPDEVHFAVRVAKGEYTVDEITRWLADRVAPPTELGESGIELLLQSTRARRLKCTRCHAYMATGKYLVRCARCHAEYRALVRFGALTTSRSGRKVIQAKIGLVRLAPRVEFLVQLNPQERTDLGRPVAGHGGWQSLVKHLQSRLESDGSLRLDSDEMARIRRYAMGHGPGGFQSVLEGIVRAADRTSPGHS